MVSIFLIKCIGLKLLLTTEENVVTMINMKLLMEDAKAGKIDLSRWILIMDNDNVSMSLKNQWELVDELGDEVVYDMVKKITDKYKLESYEYEDMFANVCEYLGVDVEWC